MAFSLPYMMYYKQLLCFVFFIIFFNMLQLYLHFNAADFYWPFLATSCVYALAPALVA